MRQGFTVTELGVVVVMACALALTAGEGLARARAEAQRELCQANVHNLGLGWAMSAFDRDREWTGEPCAAEHFKPDLMADLYYGGYIDPLDVYVCPAFDGPFPREPGGVWEETDDGPRYTGALEGTCYFADEARLPREPVEARVILADGIEMVTRFGAEPANHADERGRAAGANVLFVDMAVDWVPVDMAEHAWVMDRHGVNGPRGIGYAAGVETYPHVTGGTWRRFGFISNPRLVPGAPPEVFADEGRMGEDDIPNTDAFEDGQLRPADVDDVYYEECDRATYGAEYGDECPWGFVAKARGARCVTKSDKDPRDCSLGGGSLEGWRGGEAGTYKEHPELQGSEPWGWPDELPREAPQPQK